MSKQWSDTDEFLALKFPGINKSWLRRVCEHLGMFKGSADMTVNFRPKNRVPQTKWTFIQEAEESGEPERK
jgi:hypothetical protein